MKERGVEKNMLLCNFCWPCINQEVSKICIANVVLELKEISILVTNPLIVKNEEYYFCFNLLRSHFPEYR